MAYSYNERTAASSGDKTYAFSFPYLDTDHIKLKHAGADLTQGDAVNGFTLSGSDAIIGSGVTVTTGDVVRVYRETPRTSMVDFQAGRVKETNLDTAHLQDLYVALEALDQAFDMLPTGGAAGSVLVKTSLTDYDVQWDSNLASSVAQVISNWGTSAWAATECVYWNTTPRVNQDSIITVETGDVPAGTLGNCIEIQVDGDFEFDFDLTVNNSGTAGTIRVLVYHKPDGGAWTALSGDYLVEQAGAGSGSKVNVCGSLIIEGVTANDRIAILLSPTNAPTEWSCVDKGSQMTVRRIG